MVWTYDSYVETSDSAIFITALARGVKYGWIDEKVKDFITETWDALYEKMH